MYKTIKRYAVANRIKEYVTDHGLKQAWIANKIGVNLPTLNRWFNASREIPLIPYVRICKALGLPADYFIEDSDYEGDLYD